MLDSLGGCQHLLRDIGRHFDRDRLCVRAVSVLERIRKKNAQINKQHITEPHTRSNANATLCQVQIAEKTILKRFFRRCAQFRSQPQIYPDEITKCATPDIVRLEPKQQDQTISELTKTQL